MAHSNRLNLRLDEATLKKLEEGAKESKTNVSDYVRQILEGERNELDKMTKARVTAQVASLQKNLDAQTAALESKLKSMNDLILEMQYRFYATWIFFSKPREEIEKTKNVVIAVDEIAAHIAENESKNDLEKNERG